VIGVQWISDLFFPYAEGHEQMANGLVVAATCQKYCLPFVICTAGYHHGTKYEFPNRVLRAMGSEMVDCHTDGQKDAEGPHKNWQKAYTIVKELCEKMQ